MSATAQPEIAKILAGVCNLLPDLLAVFRADTLLLIQINAAGKKLLDPSGTRSLDKTAQIGRAHV